MAFKGLIARGSPPNPLYALVLRIATLVISVVLLGISAWGIDLIENPARHIRKRETVNIPGLGDFDLGDLGSSSSSLSGLGSSSASGSWHGSDAFALGIFSAIYIAIAVVTITLIEKFVARFLFRIGPIITYSLAWVFLLATWALAASDAAALQSWGYNRGDKYSKSIYAAYGALAGLGALLWGLVTADLALYILRSLKHPDSIGAQEAPTQLQATPSKVEAGYGANPHAHPNQYPQEPTIA